MKRLLLLLTLLVLLAGLNVWDGLSYNQQFVGIRAYDMNARSYVDEKGIYHSYDAPVLAGARALICAKGDCQWVTTDATGLAGLWLDWGMAFSVTPAKPLGYNKCVSYSIVGWTGVVGETAIMQDEVWTGWCSRDDTNKCSILTGCSGNYLEIGEDT